MSKKDQEQESLPEVNEAEAVDMTGVEETHREPVKEQDKSRLEKEEEKKSAKPAEKGAWICITAIKSDGKTYKRGEVYDGKMYKGIEKSLMSKADWDNR